MVRSREPGAQPIRVVVADDHPALVAAVTATLATGGIEVVGRAGDGHAALAAIEAERPDVALLDARMPRSGGIDVARATPGTPVVLYTGFGDRALLAEALDAGVRGFVLKQSPVEDLVRAVETVAAGGAYVDPTLAGSLVEAKLAGDLPELTQREREVLRLLADGLSNEAIAKRLSISPQTVRVYLQKAMAKLEASTRTQAVATALRQSLIA